MSVRVYLCIGPIVGAKQPIVIRQTSNERDCKCSSNYVPNDELVLLQCRYFHWPIGNRANW